MKLPKVYEPGAYESDIYALWEKAEVFKADPTRQAERFSIAMPPPNETGTLSLGHALFLTLQDIMARHARQQGKEVLWLPGTDHAALPVNAIIEKKLADQGKTKHDVGREEFLRITREFVGNSRETMLTQMRAMGASADWSRLRYTLDDALSRSVNETFVKMYESGLIYRGHRIVNWDPVLETNVSDDEVQHVEEVTTFYTFKYGPFEIGTARPETKFGDKYVVMHPDDKRYAQYMHGDTFECEWINGKVTATVIKDEAVDPEFGTGVMTITPWHDITDFEIAERHNLDKQQIIDFKGKLLPVAGEFAGMYIADARPKIAELLDKKGLLVKTETNYLHNVAINERGKAKIEPQIRLQWFVDVNKPAVTWKGQQKSLKDVMRAVIDDHDIQILPQRFNKTYFHWIDNLRDWCITRQIWWGHRLPVWYRQTENGEQTHVGITPPADDQQGWHEWEQDPDTLDTWFSSALWTWSTLIDQNLAADQSISFEDLLKNSPDFNAFHPTSVMETGYDILFFWVARMILATTFMTGQVPFKKVYLHGMVRAEDGKKMSKSRPESIIDPLTIIPQYGTDALRMALIGSIAPGADQSWSTPKIESARNFANKLWNIARFIEDKLGDDYQQKHKPQAQTSSDHWILDRLSRAIKEIDSALNNFRFSEGFDTLYHTVWDDFADWYIEASKGQVNAGVLAWGLETILKIAHPYAPFVTETIWQTLSWEPDTLLAAGQKVSHPKFSSVSAKEFEEIRQVVSEVRTIKASLQLRKTTLYHSGEQLLNSNAELIKKLSGINGVSEVQAGQGLNLTTTAFRCWLDVDQDTALRYVKKLQQAQSEHQQNISRLEGRLSAKSYVQNAPKELVNQSKLQLQESKDQLDKISTEIKRYSQI